jgi:hypothetical protein
MRGQLTTRFVQKMGPEDGVQNICQGAQGERHAVHMVHEGVNDDTAAFSPYILFVWHKQLFGSSGTNDLQLAVKVLRRGIAAQDVDEPISPSYATDASRVSSSTFTKMP